MLLAAGHGGAEEKFFPNLVILPPAPAKVGASVSFKIEDPDSTPGLKFSWDFGDGGRRRCLSLITRPRTLIASRGIIW